MTGKGNISEGKSNGHGNAASTTQLRQISLRLSAAAGHLVNRTEVDPSAQLDIEAMRKAMPSPASANSPVDISNTSPYPLYVPTRKIHELRVLQSAIHKSVIDIVPRWWNEGEELASRMPLEEDEEEVLRWLSTRRAYEPGCYRPDILLEEESETWKVCELNARFPYNGFLSPLPLLTGAVGTCPEALEQLSLKSANEPEAIRAHFTELFEPNKPLHILYDKEAWVGFDIHIVAKLFGDKTGQAVHFVLPSSMRLSEEGTLFSTETGKDVEVQQVALEAPQALLKAMGKDILKRVSLMCRNDLRTVLLVHDKRFLGILRQEAPDLHERGVLDQDEYHAIMENIVETRLSRTDTFHEVFEQCKVNPMAKDDFVLKAIRSGFGRDHIFGYELEQEAWMAELEKLAKPLVQGGPVDGHVLQRYVRQQRYPIWRHMEQRTQEYYLVVSLLSLQGHYMGVGPTRIGERTHVRLGPGELGIALASLTDA